MRITLDVLEEFLKEDHAQSDSLAKLLYNSKQEITVSFIASSRSVAFAEHCLQIFLRGFPEFGLI